MDLRARNQYLETIVTKNNYHGITKRQKSEVLKEYCKNTGQNRKHIIYKIQKGLYLHTMSFHAMFLIFDVFFGSKFKIIIPGLDIKINNLGTTLENSRKKYYLKTK
ncbi:MAG: hypothetical protein HYU63_05070 [Armatimonadetes bacterium]|nr:hypothetical protein [Armatimonadota bacterium]